MKTDGCVIIDDPPIPLGYRSSPELEEQLRRWASAVAHPSGSSLVGSNIEVQVTDDPLLLNPPRPDTVLAFDPGVAFMGIAVLDITSHEGKVQHIEVRHREQFKTPAGMPIEQRLDAVCKRIEWAFATYHPDVVGWENVVAVSAGKDSKGGASSNGGRIKEVCGMIRMACRVYADRPSRILMPATYRKMAFGKGKSKGKSKKDMRRIIEQYLNLRAVTLDESEALAMALCAFGQWKGAEWSH